MAEQIAKLALFVSDDGACERACVDLLRGHRKVQDLSTSDAEITLSGLSLNSNCLMATFHVRPGIDFANVRGFLTDGRFERLSVAEVERYAGP